MQGPEPPAPTLTSPARTIVRRGVHAVTPAGFEPIREPVVRLDPDC